MLFEHRKPTDSTSTGRGRATRPCGGRLGILALAVLTTLAVAAGPAVGAPAERTTRPVISLTDFTAVGSSTLVRTDQGMSPRIDTTGLIAGDVVTLWWVVFNDPQDCEAGLPGLSMCGPQDHLQGRGQASVLHAAGRIAAEDGTASYGAHLRTGDTSRALEGPGLLAAREAELILVLKTHGPKIRGLVSEQLRTFAGGCHDQSDVPPGAPPEMVGTPGPNDCAEIQVSVHSP
ncbi:MAG: hypothetical protein M3O70_11135 [Actinomycetota bacterium]|nr:hypothetical protein [Actinomycetota bacterium]